MPVGNGSAFHPNQRTSSHRLITPRPTQTPTLSGSRATAGCQPPSTSPTLLRRRATTFRVHSVLRTPSRPPWSENGRATACVGRIEWETDADPLAGILKTPRERLWLAPGPFATSVGPHRAVRRFGATASSAEGFVGSLAPLARTPGPLGSGWTPRPMTGPGPGPSAIGKPRGRYGHPTSRPGGTRELRGSFGFGRARPAKTRRSKFAKVF